MKPTNCRGSKVSLPVDSCTIQTSTVRDVSIVERWADEAFLVTVTPKALNEAIEKQIRIERNRMTQLASKSLKALIVSSSLP